MDLLLGTLLLRPYVFGFLAAFLGAGALDLGWRRTVGFGAVVWPVAWLAEFASTRWGVPFGLYRYTGETRGRELFIADVPFMDALSFTFLAYAAFCLARAALRGRTTSRAAVAATAGTLMMILDVVIDPAAVRGDRWFLGRIFYYVEPGVYFGVPLSNFAGWWLVGTAGIAGYYLLIEAWTPGCRSTGPKGGTVPDRRAGRPRVTGRLWPGVALYYAVLSFNLAVTAAIGEWLLFGLGLALHTLVALSLLALRPAAGRRDFDTRGIQRA